MLRLKFVLVMMAWCIACCMATGALVLFLGAWGLLAGLGVVIVGTKVAIDWGL